MLFRILKLIDRKWWALLAIVIVSMIVNQTLIDTKFYFTLNTKTRDILEITLIFVILNLGDWGIKYKMKWVSIVWKFTYYGGLSFFVVATLFDWFIYHYSTNGRFRFLSIKQVFWSPIIYLSLLLLTIKYKNKG